MVAADESSWPLEDIVRGGRLRQWLCRTGDAVSMRFLPTRGSPPAVQLLSGLAVLVCDRWSAYKAPQRMRPDRLKLAFDSARKRRGFWQVATGFPGLEG